MWRFSSLYDAAQMHPHCRLPPRLQPMARQSPRPLSQQQLLLQQTSRQQQKPSVLLLMPLRRSTSTKSTRRGRAMLLLLPLMPQVRRSTSTRRRRNTERRRQLRCLTDIWPHNRSAVHLRNSQQQYAANYVHKSSWQSCYG